MPAARRNLPADFRVIDRMPFRDDMEVRWNIEQTLQQQGPRLRGKLLQREDAEVIIVHPQIAAMRL